MFALIKNNIIEVGPREWNKSIFERYLKSIGDTTELPITAPTSTLAWGSWKIVPVEPPEIPPHDQIFEQLVGPYWNINSIKITGYYNVVPNTIDMIKAKLKEIVTANRYDVEIAGVDYTLLDGTTVKIYTNRVDRGVYLDALQLLPDGQYNTFKFGGGVFKTISKEELLSVVMAGTAHVQGAFLWESQKIAEIDSLETVADLKLVDIKHPSQV